MTDRTPLTEQQIDDQAVQILSNEGAQCGNCGDQPGDRVCPDCEKCRHRYVAALRAAGWAPRVEAEGAHQGGTSTERAFCGYGVTSAPGSGCILRAGHEPANRHVVTPGDTDDE